MTPLQALRAATGWAAECIGRGDDLGTVEKGKLADLVVVTGDPLADVAILQKPQNIALVIKDGEIAAEPAGRPRRGERDRQPRSCEECLARRASRPTTATARDCFDCRIPAG